MVAFNFDNKNINEIIEDNKTELLSDFNEKKGVVYFTDGAYIGFNENALPLLQNSYCIKVTFQISQTASTSMVLLQGNSIPLNISLIKDTSNTYLISAGAYVNGNFRTAISKETIEKNKWYTLEFVLLDGQFYFKINDVVFGRRVYAYNPSKHKPNNPNIIYLGKSDNSNELNNFDGYIDYLSFENYLTNEQNDLASQFENERFMEIESKIQDLSFKNIHTGKLESENNSVYIESNCFYNVYENGVIFWSPDYNYVWMSKAIFEKYLILLNQTIIGIPKNDEEMVNQNSFFCRFVNGALFRGGNLEEIVHIPEDIFLEYESDIDKYIFPKSEPITTMINDVKMVYVFFKMHAIFYFLDGNGVSSVFVLTKTVADQYISSYKELGPIEKYDKGFTDIENQCYYEYLTCKNQVLCIKNYTNGNLDFIPMNKDFFNFFVQNNGLNKDENFGKYKYPKAGPTFNKNGIEYQNFFGGVIFRNNNQIHGFSTLKFYFIRAECGKIDDGWGWKGKDRTPEMYIVVYLGKNQKYNIVDGKRWPDYSVRKHGGSHFNIVYEGATVDEEHLEGKSVYYSIPDLQGEDIIYFHVDVYDFDKISKNDYLGSYTFEFDIDTGWGVLDMAVTSGKEYFRTQEKTAVYTGVHLTHQGADNRGGFANIKLTFSIESEAISVNIDDYFRKFAYWSIDNFGAIIEVNNNNNNNNKAEEKKTKEIKLSNRKFDIIFNTQTDKDSDWILNFSEKVWSRIIINNFSGGEGLCFGFSTSALDCVNGRGTYPLPLCLWNLDINDREGNKHNFADEVKPEFFELVQEKHVYQAGWAHIEMIINKTINGEFFVPTKSFKKIKDIIDQDKYCLVSVIKTAKMEKIIKERKLIDSAHTMVAYKYDNDKIYVADSNHPWYENDLNMYKDISNYYQNINVDTSYIKLSSDIVKKVELFYSGTTLEKTYDYCYATPYHVVSKPPRIPSFGQFLQLAGSSIFLHQNFIVNNLFAFLVMICSGDVESIECSGVKEESPTIQIPIFGDDNIFNNIKLKFTLVQDKLQIKIKGTRKGSYCYMIIGRNRLITIEASTKSNEIDSFEISKLSSRKPIVKNLNHDNKTYNILVERFIYPYGEKASKTNINEQKPLPAAPINNHVNTYEKYYLNRRAQKSGDHEMHREGCPGLPIEKNRIYLGEFNNEFEALEVAKKYYKKVNGCSICNPETDTDKFDTSLNSNKLR